jgi:hypothetical protein
MDNPEKKTILNTQDTRRRQIKFKKRGDEIKKKSSPLKLQSQFQPNFAEMILRGEEFFFNFIPPFF